MQKSQNPCKLSPAWRSVSSVSGFAQLHIILHLLSKSCKTSQEVEEEGVHANGFVTVLPLPEEVYGRKTRKTLPLRRMEGIVGEVEAETHFRKELMKVTCFLNLFSPPA